MLWLVTGVAPADARLDGFDDVYGDDLQSINVDVDKFVENYLLIHGGGGTVPC